MRYVEQSEWHQVSGGVEVGGGHCSLGHWQMLNEQAKETEAVTAAVLDGVFAFGGSMLLFSSVTAMPVTAPVLIVAGALSLYVTITVYNLNQNALGISK